MINDSNVCVCVFVSVVMVIKGIGFNSIIVVADDDDYHYYDDDHHHNNNEDKEHRM